MPYITTILLSPFNIMFFVIIIGYIIGKIRIKGVSLGIAGILFASILFGRLVNMTVLSQHCEIITSVQSTLKTFSRFGTSMFVSVIGLQTGFCVRHNSKGSAISFIIGAMMSISGIATMMLISVFDKSISHSSLLGILCGALTNTPGLSAVCELSESGSENAVIGYGCSYLPGVVFAVFFSQLLSKRKIHEKQKTNQTQNTGSKTHSELMLISISALLGNLFGSFMISLGTTAATLLSGLIIGCIARKRSSSVVITTQTMNSLRNLGLALFFAGNGFSTGVQTVIFSIKTVLYGVLITLSALFCGLMLCGLIGGKNGMNKGFVIAGGMTSSPAYGAISDDATELSVNCFSFSYFGALIALVLSIPTIA